MRGMAVRHRRRRAARVLLLGLGFALVLTWLASTLLAEFGHRWRWRPSSSRDPGRARGAACLGEPLQQPGLIYAPPTSRRGRPSASASTPRPAGTSRSRPSGDPHRCSLECVFRARPRPA